MDVRFTVEDKTSGRKIFSLAPADVASPSAAIAWREDVGIDDLDVSEHDENYDDEDNDNVNDSR